MCLKTTIAKRNKHYIRPSDSVMNDIKQSLFAIISAWEIDRPKSTKSSRLGFAARRRIGAIQFSVANSFPKLFP